MTRAATAAAPVLHSHAGESMTPFPDSVQLPGKTVRRRWRVPAAAVSGIEPLDEMGVLRENRGQRGLVLWQALRDAVLWAQTPPSEREGLFSPEAGARRTAAMLAARMEISLAGPLTVLTELVKRPERIRAEQLALACREVSSWAEARGVLATAQGYAEAAALVSPADASAAFKAGQLARKCADYPRAERWLRRAAAVARQDPDRCVSALAFIALGNVYFQRGKFPNAKRFHTRGLNIARRHNLSGVQGRALHDLFVIASLAQDIKEAEQLGMDAFWAYGPDHEKIPILAHDLAYSWTLQHQYGRALPVFQALMPHMKDHESRVTALSNIARCAGEVGDVETFRKAWSDAWNALSATTARDGCAEAMLELAKGAAAIHDERSARQACNEALQLSVARGEARIRLAADQLLDALDEGTAMGSKCGTGDAVSIDSVLAGDPFAEEVVRTLQIAAGAH